MYFLFFLFIFVSSISGMRVLLGFTRLACTTVLCLSLPNFTFFDILRLTMIKVEIETFRIYLNLKVKSKNLQIFIILVVLHRSVQRGAAPSPQLRAGIAQF